MTLVCQWCGAHFERPNTRGPIPKFCRASHRQRAHQLRVLERFKAQVLEEHEREA